MENNYFQILLRINAGLGDLNIHALRNLANVQNPKDMKNIVEMLKINLDNFYDLYEKQFTDHVFDMKR